MATSVMSANNNPNNSTTSNNGVVANIPTSYSLQMFPAASNQNFTNFQYLQQSTSNHPYFPEQIIQQSNMNLYRNAGDYYSQFLDIYGRNQVLQHLQPKIGNSNVYQQPNIYHDYSNQQVDDLMHVHSLMSNNNNLDVHQHAQFFSPEHVDGMVSILKGEEDFIQLLESGHPNMSEVVAIPNQEDEHAFNPTLATSSPTRKNSTPSINNSELKTVKSPSSNNSSTNQATNSDNVTSRTTSPTNSQEKNSSAYPNGRKRASKACVECQKRHTRCGFERPCERCVRLGLNCVEMKSEKKRGRSTMTGSTPSDILSTTNNTTPLNSKHAKVKENQQVKKRKNSPTNAPQSSSATTNKNNIIVINQDHMRQLTHGVISTADSKHPQISAHLEKQSPTSSNNKLNLDPDLKLNHEEACIDQSQRGEITLSGSRSPVDNSPRGSATTPLMMMNSSTVLPPSSSSSSYSTSPTTTTTTNIMYSSAIPTEKSLGVIAVGNNFTSIQFISDPLIKMFNDEIPNSLNSIMTTEFIQQQINLLCEARITRETIMKHVDDGISVLQKSHLKVERSARSLILLKDNKQAEMTIKFLFMYNSENPAMLDSAYVFLFWDGKYFIR